VTHSGGKPHAVGDRGQRYEVTYFDPSSNSRKVMGWCSNLARAEQFSTAIDKHPVWRSPQIRDRETSFVPDGAPWIPTAVELPPEGVVVDTKIDDANCCRNEQPMKRRGRLWWFADDSMYVYYTPTHWKYVVEDPHADQA